MKTVAGSTGTIVSYSVEGSGPPLVLVHGSFSDHDTNWTFVTPFFRQRLMDHFGQDPAKLPTLTEKFDNFEHANVHLAIESALAQPQTRSEMMGAAAPHGAFGLTMAALAAPKASSDWDVPTEAPLEYINIRLEGERVVACVQSGLCLMSRADERLAVLIVGAQRDYHPAAQVRVEHRGSLAAVGARTEQRSPHVSRVQGIPGAPKARRDPTRGGSAAHRGGGAARGRTSERLPAELPVRSHQGD